MNRLLRLYDYFAGRHAELLVLLAVVVAMLTMAAAGLRYREDISDFLPSDDEYREAMAVYEQLNDAQRIVIIFEGASPDSLCAAVDRFAEAAVDAGLDEEKLTTEVDVTAFVERLRFVHAHAPFFLSDCDYERMNTLFTPEGYRSALAREKQILAMPGSGILSQVLSSDPLQLFSLSAGASGQYAGASAGFTSHEGYMMSADKTQAFAFYDSPYGSTESRRNATLVDSLETVLHSLNLLNPSNPSHTLSARLLGAPVIATGNARRIKHDSFMAIGISIVLITLLLLYSFPRRRDILLIAFSVAFGWLCGMAMLRIFVGQVSVIVLGIGSVIMGLAVNYPLHLLVHQRYTSSVRQTLQEVLSPLLIGNITTVGAFLALLPIRATALRDLGIFASAMLLGTIVFCIVFLPHMMSAEKTPLREIRFPKMRDSFPHSVADRLSLRRKNGLRTSSHTAPYYLTGAIVVLTLLFAAVLFIHREDSRFDTNLSHLNYMTPTQRADFARFEAIGNTGDSPAYTIDEAKEELQRRLTLWDNWWADKDRGQLLADFRAAAQAEGFRAGAFEPFETMIESGIGEDLDVQHYDSKQLAAVFPGRFDSASLNARMATNLSDNFDYLGLVCSLIVFVFLCFSFRSLRLGIIAFLPMVVSWLWILGIMQLTGIQFNIVNIILATFLFGQGDDYTIFVLEGALHEQRTGEKMLPQFRQSILLSALIMLITLGVLLTARHPAMHSLGVVTLIGMACVVLMAWVLPPVLLRLSRCK